MDKYFKNPYEEFDESSKIFDSETGKLEPETEKSIREKLLKLLDLLQNNLKSRSEGPDYTVYSGAAGLALLYLRFVQLQVTFEEKKIIEKVDCEKNEEEINKEEEEINKEKEEEDINKKAEDENSHTEVKEEEKVVECNDKEVILEVNDVQEKIVVSGDADSEILKNQQNDCKTTEEKKTESKDNGDIEKCEKEKSNKDFENTVIKVKDITDQKLENKLFESEDNYTGLKTLKNNCFKIKNIDLKNLEIKDTHNENFLSNDVESNDIECENTKVQSCVNKDVECKEIGCINFQSRDMESINTESRNIEVKDIEIKSIDNKDILSNSKEERDVKEKYAEGKDLDENSTEDSDIESRNLENEDTDAEDKDTDEKDIEDNDLDDKDTDDNDIYGNELDDKDIEDNDTEDNDIDESDTELKDTEEKDIDDSDTEFRDTEEKDIEVKDTPTKLIVAKEIYEGIDDDDTEDEDTEDEDTEDEYAEDERVLCKNVPDSNFIENKQSNEQKDDKKITEDSLQNYETNNDSKEVNKTEEGMEKDTSNLKHKEKENKNKEEKETIGKAKTNMKKDYIKEGYDFLKISISYIEPTFTRLELKKFSFLCGVSGALSIASVIYMQNGMENEADDLARRCQNIGEEVCRPQFPDDIMHGRAGFLYSMLFLDKYLPHNYYRPMVIREVVTSILESGTYLAKKFSNTLKLPLYFEWRKKVYIGCAHGFSGILYVLLQAHEYLSSEELDNLVRPTIDKLLELQTLEGNFPLSLDTPVDNLVHWCHGASGCCHLLLLAYEVFVDADREKYLEAARKCCDLIWEKGLLKKGCNLCHGVPGNGYAFLRFFQVTREEKYLYRALKFAEWCYDNMENGVQSTDASLALLDGFAGVVYYILDMLDPLNAGMPGFHL